MARSLATSPRLVRAALIGLVVLAALFIAAVMAAPPLVAARIRSAAARRGLEASWQSLRLRPPFGVTIRGLALTAARGDTVVQAAALEATLRPFSLLALQPWPQRFRLERARIALHSLRGSRPDTLPPDELRPSRRRRVDHLPAFRRSAQRVVRALTLAAGHLPRIDLEDVTIESSAGGEEPPQGLHFDRLGLAPSPGGTRLEARGALALDGELHFAADLDYGRDETLTGRLVFRVPGTVAPGPDSLAIELHARLARERRPRGLRLAEGSVLIVGRIPVAVSGSLEESGPRLTFALAADTVRPADLVAGVPAALLGPLREVGVRGSFGYRLRFDLDLAWPDSVDFHAAVLPRGLALDPERTRLNLLGLDAPFTATIRLPHGRAAVRDLSPANPCFRPLEAMDSTLVHAVLTNEDGGFFHHRGFNTDAVKQAVVENLHAGAYRRGAGTITMQLARNLYVGHERTLPRKAQEVALAWMLEHLTGVSKRRLLEIYLNIIEWGPGVHGADEAARYYFGHDAGSVTVAEALFLSTVIPAPNRWRWRFDQAGALRSYARAQMHFIGRAMIARGWLASERLPPADSLAVALNGPAGLLLAPAADSSLAAPAVERTPAATITRGGHGGATPF